MLSGLIDQIVWNTLGNSWRFNIFFCFWWFWKPKRKFQSFQSTKWFHNDKFQTSCHLANGWKTWRNPIHLREKTEFIIIMVVRGGVSTSAEGDWQSYISFRFQKLIMNILHGCRFTWVARNDSSWRPNFLLEPSRNKNKIEVFYNKLFFLHRLCCRSTHFKRNKISSKFALFFVEQVLDTKIVKNAVFIFVSIEV